MNASQSAAGDGQQDPFLAPPLGERPEWTLLSLEESLQEGAGRADVSEFMSLSRESRYECNSSPVSMGTAVCLC